MLKQIFIDNYKCLVNFELNPDKIALLLGANGSGKSCVFEVLLKLREFITGIKRITSVFCHDTLTKWQRLPIQRFGLTITLDKAKYEYGLEIEHELNKKLCRVKKEWLLFDDRPLFQFENGNAQLYNDNFQKGPEYPFDWSQSGLSALQQRPENQLLTRFKEWLSQMIIVRPVPSLMGNESAGEDAYLSLTADNFSSWYRYLSQEHQGKVFDLINRLRDILDGFHSFRLAKTGEEQRSLQVAFQRSETAVDPIYYRFLELSDGQRIIILLYTLLIYVKDQPVCLCLDEPENYLALPEIQPWLSECFDEISQGQGQMLIISHHPEIINYLASGYGYWFGKEANMPVRLQRIAENGSGLPISELVARRWLYE
jgi:predicted ATPase